MEGGPENQSMRDEFYRNCFENLSVLCTNDTDYTELDDLLLTLHAEYGLPLLNLMERYRGICRDYAELKVLFGVVGEVFSVCGTLNCDGIPLFVKVSKWLTPGKLRCAIDVYFQKDEEYFTELLKYLDTVGLSDNEFKVFAGLAIKTDIENCRQLVTLIKHYDPMDNVDHDFIQCCAGILECGNDPEIMDIAKKFSRLWQANSTNRVFLIRVNNALIHILRNSEQQDRIAEAKKFIENPFDS